MKNSENASMSSSPSKISDRSDDLFLAGIHHVAYRCRNAKETVKFYERVLGMKYVSAFSEGVVPSTGERDPYMHVFLDCGGGNILAFFELPTQPDMGRDENTPPWVRRQSDASDLSARIVSAYRQMMISPLIPRFCDPHENGQ